MLWKDWGLGRSGWCRMPWTSRSTERCLQWRHTRLAFLRAAGTFIRRGREDSRASAKRRQEENSTRERKRTQSSTRIDFSQPTASAINGAVTSGLESFTDRAFQNDIFRHFFNKFSFTRGLFWWKKDENYDTRSVGLSSVCDSLDNNIVFLFFI